MKGRTMKGRTMTIHDQLKQYLAENFLADPNATVPDDLDLLGSGVIDSLGMLKLISWIESTYDISISDVDLDPANFQNVDSVEALVERAQTPTATS